MKLTPKNRNLLVKIKENPPEETAILLPDDYKRADPYTVVEILDVAESCNSFTPDDIGKLVIIPTHTIVSIEVDGETHSLALENLALGVVDEE